MRPFIAPLALLFALTLHAADEAGKWIPISDVFIAKLKVDAKKPTYTGNTAGVAVKHESGGELVYSEDAAKTWKSLGKGFKHAGIFDGGIIMAGKADGIYRSTDAQNFTKVFDTKLVGLAMRNLKGNGYWTTDTGTTWKTIAPLPQGFNVGFTGPNYAWDAKNGILYASSMGKPNFKYILPK